MKRITENLFFFIILIYCFSVLFFLAKVVVKINVKQQSLVESPIPILAVGKLNNVYQVLVNREQINYPKVDLGNFKFGKTEPFSP
ncbi:MAG: hypothetical protein V1858_03775 [Candidatus Gottesmanbacteria bacterium]